MTLLLTMVVCCTSATLHSVTFSKHQTVVVSENKTLATLFDEIKSYFVIIDLRTLKAVLSPVETSASLIFTIILYFKLQGSETTIPDPV